VAIEYQTAASARKAITNPIDGVRPAHRPAISIQINRIEGMPSTTSHHQSTADRKRCATVVF
jgi:hypothetical protein